VTAIIPTTLSSTEQGWPDFLVAVGYWECLVGLTKSPMKKTLGHAHITLTSLQTLVVEIEAHLNNRPLIYISSELNDRKHLTPSHLLYGRKINTIPHPAVEQDEIDDENYTVNPPSHSNLSKKAKAQALIFKHLWNHWRREYLTSL